LAKLAAVLQLGEPNGAEKLWAWSRSLDLAEIEKTRNNLLE